jgi:uncharacterized membrane protein
MSLTQRFFGCIVTIILICFGLSSVSAQSTESDVRDRAYDREMVKDRRMLKYPYLREADVFFEKRVWCYIFA